MKKQGIINSEIAALVAQLGHKDMIVIGDSGLPVPAGVPKIDVAIRWGLPSFQDVLDSVLTEMEVEKIVLANEIMEKNHDQWQETIAKFTLTEIDYCSHEDFKELTKAAKAVIRTGEATPYSNIILVSGVCF
ncbi:D-ribose pyranase [Rubeoparvulum massiliense]|uniref:D-ribose pyranase n=1 Tax=Rubeoparvulum massiliense TaxID=1631346 RepID=UPI00065E3AB3|nr:D-ribose pyranase [Rubeoparvulum massiliense]